MMADIPETVTLVPIDRIEVLNSRDRTMTIFEDRVTISTNHKKGR